VKLIEVPIEPLSLDRFEGLVGKDALREARVAAEAVRRHLAGRVLLNVNSTAVGGGVAEMLRPQLAYARGAGIDARWSVIRGGVDFFKLTKRLHHALHGVVDGSFSEGDRELYERTLDANATELSATLRPRDVVVLHDPQTAGLAPSLLRAGAIVLWRCHIGTDDIASAQPAWDFLTPYLKGVSALVFSRESYVPTGWNHEKAVIIQPSIDAASAKNQILDERTVHSILVHVGIVEGPPPADASRAFLRSDGSPGRVEHRADLIRMGRAAPVAAPLVVQISRWDPLKDPIGVMRGFARLIDADPSGDAELVLAGPNVHAVADDPEGDVVFKQTLEAWRGLPHSVRNRVTLASLPTHDVEENAAIVNALQRHAAVIVQKSLREGFGLTVTEGMWKRRPVVATRVGGIQDQIEDGKTGLLLDDPEDLDAFASAVGRLLDDPVTAKRMGEAGYQRVCERFLGLGQLVQYAELLRAVA
jgi:trehalose synthase